MPTKSTPLPLLGPSDFINVAILVVDDNKPARQLLRAYFQRLGVGRVEEASDEVEGLRILLLNANTANAFQCVFVSRMVRDKGLEFVNNVRQINGWSNFPIVVVSEDLDISFERDALTVGADEYFLRPYTELALRQILTRLFVRFFSTPPPAT